jgi:hypothetical protein
MAGRRASPPNGGAASPAAKDMRRRCHQPSVPGAAGCREHLTRLPVVIRNAARLLLSAFCAGQGLLGACKGVLESISRPMLYAFAREPEWEGLDSHRSRLPGTMSRMGGQPLAHGREFSLNLRAQQASVEEPAVDAAGNGERDTVCASPLQRDSCSRIKLLVAKDGAALATPPSARMCKRCSLLTEFAAGTLPNSHSSMAQAPPCLPGRHRLCVAAWASLQLVKAFSYWEESHA